MMIHQTLMQNQQFVEAINLLFKNKSKKKNINKLLEELSELSTALLQKVNNKNKINEREILKELVDVQMQIQIVLLYYSDIDKQYITKEKLEKFFQSATYKKYCITDKEKKK